MRHSHATMRVVFYLIYPQEAPGRVLTTLYIPTRYTNFCISTTLNLKKTAEYF